MTDDGPLPGPGVAPTAVLAPELRALCERLTALADDELILGHRNGEWTGHAPLLEEDIALANLAQDEIGHAITWYGLRAAIDGSDPDRLVYFRDASEYLSSTLVALPRGDWAFTMARQYLFDAYETELLARLAHSSHAPLAQAAVKIGREELFHLRHSQLWLERLAHGTDESRERLSGALATAVPLMSQLLAPLPGDHLLHDAGMWPAHDELRDAVTARVSDALTAVGANLDVPGSAQVSGERGGSQPGHLAELLTRLQSVARADPEAAAW